MDLLQLPITQYLVKKIKVWILCVKHGFGLAVF